MHGAAIQPTFVQTASVPYAGNTTLELTQAPTGWQVGDQLLLPSTNPHFLYDRSDTTEQATVASIDNTTVMLTNRLAYNHPGAGDGAGDTTFLPDVADLTRNIVIRSEDPPGTRGHTLFTLRADVDLEYVQFKDLGRTLAGPLDNTTYDSNGHVTHIGTNQIGRYALHMHHLEGPAQPDGSGYQFQLIGNVIDGSEKWGIDIHDSSYGLIQDNVVYHAQEDGIATELGSEYQNLFVHNFVVSAVGSGFWLNGTVNYFDDNVAADISSSGDTSILVGNGAGYFTPRNLDASVMVNLPSFPGADLTDPTQTTQVPLITTTFLDFSWDEAYGSNMGVWLDHRHGGADQGGHYLSGFQAWSMYSSSVSAYDTDGVTIDGLVARNAGVDVLSNVRTVVENADIQGRTLPGIRYWGNGLDLVIQDSYLRNTSNIEIALMATAGATVDSATHKTTTIRNVRFKAPMGDRLRAITLQYQTYGNNSRVPVVPNQIYVYDYNQHPGEDFQVFFKEQAPSFVVPYEGDIPYDPNLARKASPVPGLTNAQCWAQFGLAVAGAVSPSADDTTYPEIYGYTYPLAS
jgi:hypothetical protein